MNFTEGKILAYFPAKGYGFIGTREGGVSEKFFFHIKEVQYNNPEVNDRVRFLVKKSEVRPTQLCCCKVHKIEKDGQNS